MHGNQLETPAALHGIIALSEATQALSDQKKAQHSHIPWRQISGYRNILVHNYLGTIDAVTVRAVIEIHLTPLGACIRQSLDEAS